MSALVVIPRYTSLRRNGSNVDIHCEPLPKFDSVAERTRDASTSNSLRVWALPLDLTSALEGQVGQSVDFIRTSLDAFESLQRETHPNSTKIHGHRTVRADRKSRCQRPHQAGPESHEGFSARGPGDRRSRSVVDAERDRGPPAPECRWTYRETSRCSGRAVRGESPYQHHPTQATRRATNPLQSKQNHRPLTLGRIAKSYSEQQLKRHSCED